jgi:YfiH family protein
MALEPAGALRVFRFESIPPSDVVHAVMTRQGGVSPAPWESLNVGGNLGDDPDRVAENRRRVFDALGLDPSRAHDVWQVHSADIVVVREPRRGGPLRRADGMVTDQPELTLFMRFADCVPIMVFDPARRAVGLAHAGWLGTVRQTARSLVRAMVEGFGSRPEELRAGLGPSIGAHHYPVGDEVVEQFAESFGGNAAAHLSQASGRSHLNLWSANRWLLEDEGVGRIEVSGVCTACDLEHWYSHRGDGGRTGRFAAAIALRG